MRNRSHTFVICAYGENPYLEECIQSLKRQTVPVDMLLVTSTPCEYLQEMCGKYQIPYYVRKGESNISLDWNYALSVADTEYVTIAHQDDVYEPDYAKRILRAIGREEQTYHRTPLILFTDYRDLIGGEKFANRRNLKVKRMLLAPLRNGRMQGVRFWKRWVLRFGNAICCPTVTYHMDAIRDCMQRDGRSSLFHKHFRSNVDWETWEWLSRYEGSFVYVRGYLMAHRIHAGSETSAVIRDRLRQREDYEMFCRFWPKWFAGCLTGVYQKSERDNAVN